MDLSTVHKLYEALADARWGFFYSGDFHDEHSARLIMLAEEASKAFTGTGPSLTKKLAFVLVEAYQNVIRHRAPLEKALERGAARSMFMLRSDGRSYEVAAMNPIRREEVAGLRALLEHIRKNADLKQLKEMFLRGLQSEGGSQRGGAGLGLIEMARRSSAGLHHELRELEGSELMFTIRLRVGSSNMADSHMGHLYEHQQAMASIDALLLFKGEFTPGIQNALMRMMATDMDEHPGRSDARTKAFLAAMEMIGELPHQNADPIIVLGRVDGHYSLVIGLVLETRDAERFGRQLEALRGMDPNAIQRVYRDALLGRNADGAFTSTGALDLARRSTEPLSTTGFPHKAASLLLIEAMI
jgi:hypothetical protein